MKKVAKKPKQKKRDMVHVLLTREGIDRLDEWRASRRPILNRSAALRELLTGTCSGCGQQHTKPWPRANANGSMMKEDAP